MNIVIATLKSWNIKKAYQLKEDIEPNHSVFVVTKKEELNIELISKINPDYIFFPHWSYFIPETIYRKWDCVVFHMTDLPFGRGGSPLQNLIIRGYKDTVITAIKAVEELDAGPIYMKEELELDGSAEEIFKRASDVIFDKMIPFLIEKNPEPVPQTGEITTFQRRTPEESLLPDSLSLSQIYNYIRMLDGEGYPKAFLLAGNYKLEFCNAKFKAGSLTANVEFVRNKHE